MLKCFNLNANILPKHSDIHNYSTRNNNKFTAPKCNIRKSEMSLNFKSIKVSNKLPADNRTSDYLNVFMVNLRNYFVSRYWVYLGMNFIIFSDMLYLCVMCYQQQYNIPLILRLTIVLSVRMPIEELIAYNWAHMFWCTIF